MEGQTKTISLTIVRHGQTDANKNKILHGWRTNIPVNSFGIKQAQAAGMKIIRVFVRLCAAHPHTVQVCTQCAERVRKATL